MVALFINDDIEKIAADRKCLGHQVIQDTTVVSHFSDDDKHPPYYSTS